MAKVYGDRVQMTTATTGTGTITLGSASSGYRAFSTVLSNSDTTDILIVDGTAWEVAKDCTYTSSGTTITRGTLVASSTGSAINLSGSATVAIVSTAALAQAVHDSLIARPAGKILQMVETTSTTETSTSASIPFDNTKPQNTEGAELITRAITPIASTSTLEVEFSSQLTTNSGAAWMVFALFKDSDADAIGAGLYYVAAVNECYPINIRWMIAAGSTSARTYKVRWGVSAGTGYVNRLSAGSYFNGLATIRLGIKEVGA